MNVMRMWKIFVYERKCDCWWMECDFSEKNVNRSIVLILLMEKYLFEVMILGEKMVKMIFDLIKKIVW